MGFDKLIQPLGDSFVLQHSVTTFCDLEVVSQVSVVTTEERFQDLLHHPKLNHVEGGAERHFSVIAGIQVLKNVDSIAVHDGARPLISKSQIITVLEQAKKHQAATSAHRISDTLKKSNSGNFAVDSVSRDQLWAMETPQIFSTPTLASAYQKVLSENLLVTDEVSAVEHIGVKTKLVANPQPNLKITYPEDLKLAEILLKHLSQ